MMITFIDVVVGILFAIVGLAVVSWIGIIIPELQKFLVGHKTVSSILAFVFNAAPAQDDASKTYRPVGFVIKDIIPIILWLLILVPMFIFPIILIVFPIFHIPWSYLLPPSP